MLIVYIHICQKGDWKRSLKMILDKLVESGLYHECLQIRCGVVNDEGILRDDAIFSDPKIRVIGLGHSREYERPTLMHMRNAALNDDYDGCKYLYCHTKGLRWFDTSSEEFVIDWIKLLLYWNIERWRDAVLKLDEHDTYGCNYITDSLDYPAHYSGNFFWANSSYLKTLPDKIGCRYCDPEFWVGKRKPNYFDAFNSKIDHYENLFPEHLYKI